VVFGTIFWAVAVSAALIRSTVRKYESWDAFATQFGVLTVAIGIMGTIWAVGLGSNQAEFDNSVWGLVASWLPVANFGAYPLGLLFTAIRGWKITEERLKKLDLQVAQQELDNGEHIIG